MTASPEWLPSLPSSASLSWYFRTHIHKQLAFICISFREKNTFIVICWLLHSWEINANLMNCQTWIKYPNVNAGSRRVHDEPISIFINCRISCCASTIFQYWFESITRWKIISGRIHISGSKLWLYLVLRDDSNLFTHMNRKIINNKNACKSDIIQIIIYALPSLSYNLIINLD